MTCQVPMYQMSGQAPHQTPHDLRALRTQSRTGRLLLFQVMGEVSRASVVPSSWTFQGFSCMVKQPICRAQ